MISLVSLGGWAATALSSKAVRVGLIALSIVIVLVRFYSWAEDNGRTACELKVERMRLEEVLRQKAITQRAVKAAEKRALEAELSENEARKTVQAAIDAARKAEAAGQVCVGKDVTDALRLIK